MKNNHKVRGSGQQGIYCSKQRCEAGAGAGAGTQCVSGSDGSGPTMVLTWLGIENRPKKFITHSVHIFTNINRAESNEKDSFNIFLNFSPFSEFCLAIQ
jgi:hypothetical protein